MTWHTVGKVRYREAMRLDSNGNLGIGVTPSRSPVYQIDTPLEDATVIIGPDDGTGGMLKIAKDGFYVRGVKVAVDEQEAETVYRAFKQWLTWAQLERD